jgi:exonuclease III
LVLNESPDIYCLQETKAEQLEEYKESRGYNHILIIQRLEKDSGIYVNDVIKDKSTKVEYGMGNIDLDQEGRFLGILSIIAY